MGKTLFYCTECGASYPKWLGKCEECNQWNTIVEETQISTNKSNAKPIEFVSLSGTDEVVERKTTDIPEFDRVLGGGAVPGAVILIGGDPGIGKSTLLLQASAALSEKYSCVYISGEESVNQIRLRARRLGVENSKIQLASENNIESILASVHSNIDFLIVDSIQTLQSKEVGSVPGTVSQIRACTHQLIQFAKSTNTCVFLVGHVTKDGIIAGPKVLEHMVDTVLYFEGEKGNAYRILHSEKNRYGACDELGIFEMRQRGLFSVENPSALFLTQRECDTPGTAVFAGIEGSRPILVEVQALVSKSYFNVPRRNVIGWDINRLSMILGVLESRYKISFSDRDVYLSVAGGLKISEPACDLAVALSLISARANKVISRETCAFGEIGLTGEIRSVSRCNERIREAKKLGFKHLVIPAVNQYSDEDISDIKVTGVKSLMDVLSQLGVKRE